ncbi:riboflavin biosynthesis protein RibF [Enterococcus caccae]|uniref:Riboflavin biosynthesis protein n=1 Tax=Enterococcus caccae ATCC BAA-1240 TaxID=1158612 RepID=R3WEV9_9ENTE|nr:riboflavin biosynthesis protein RibF [Enterococcus caccae]EOL45967.1 riboflavin biosynthesis protein RibF [Enterococcus caccae ATCC BAA-1240]EOT61163.1 riboflavin biosynthesis protein RibF [Enterococcus caccae ATCC BAA-1240]OJG27807.1 riboflavin biosynthesis protein RibF [Enterococcus caccae]
MQIIPIRHPYTTDQIPPDEVVMVLGFFDGVHRGHQKVIETGKKIAQKKGLKLAVMTFNQHPSIVFQKVLPENMKYLNSLEQKERLMEGQGVDILYVIEFTSAFAHLAPQEFVDQYIVGLHAKVAVSGFDYTYGPKDIADVAHLPVYAKDRFEVATVSKEELGGTKISSTRIRELMEHGRMEDVTELLGYVYETDGTVVHGDARGRLLGFPTANIKVKSTVRLPRIGVYAVKIKVGDTWHIGMGSIGHNDTFGDGRDLTVEVYILDFHQDIYGEQVTVRWNHYLRDQVKFDGAESLIVQLKQDERDTVDYFL